jgi:predicted Zn-dependent protease
VSAGPRAAAGSALRTALERHPRVHAWQVRTVRVAGTQTYLVRDQLEAGRDTSQEVREVVVFVKNGDRLGRAAMTLGPAELRDPAARLERAVFMAGLGGDPEWTLPGATAVPAVPAFDAALAGARAHVTSRAVVDAWRGAVAGNPAVKPASMELFCAEDETTLENSAGFSARAASTRVSLQTLLLAGGARPAERFSWDERRRLADLDVAAIVKRVAGEAHDLTRAVVPPSGTYPVVFDADEIPALLGPIQNHASADALHPKSSRFTVGEKLPIERKGGEPFTLWSNAAAPFGLASYAFDAEGVPGQRVEIVKDDVFVRPWATRQFAQYVGTPATGAFGNWELPAGVTPEADLVRGGRVLVVRAFSWLTPDAARGGFGSEIRFGYLWENGVATPVKGGTVSGNLFDALGTAIWSRETVFRGNYLGPAAVRFEGLTVTGS